jgi:lipoate-protein ligase A
MNEDHIQLARRTTGGGAVYHDLGNSNFTFLSPKATYRKENNIQIILEALKNFGIHGEASGRNDMLIPFPDGARKFSGSAYRESRDRAFHHGTLLLHADLTRLAQYLTPNPKKLQAKGTESVRSRVINLQDVALPEFAHLGHELIVESMVQSFQNFYGGQAEIEHLNMDSLKEIPELRKQFENLSSFEWLYGKTLEFNLKLDGYLTMGFFDFHFKIEEGVIKELQINTDCLYPDLVDTMTSRLQGQIFEAKSIQKSFESIISEYPDHSMGLQEIKVWLCSEVEI